MAFYYIAEFKNSVGIATSRSNPEALVKSSPSTPILLTINLPTSVSPDHMEVLFFPEIKLMEDIE